MGRWGEGRGLLFTKQRRRQHDTRLTEVLPADLGGHVMGVDEWFDGFLECSETLMQLLFVTTDAEEVE